MKYFFTFSISLFCSVILFAQNATMQGTITDAESGEGLISATIQSGDVGTATDIEGRYQLILPPGEHNIQVSYIGYDTKKMTITLKAGETITQDFTLGEAITILNTATVSSSKFEKSLGEVTVSLDVLKAEIIDNTSATNISSAINKVSGVRIINGQANIRGGSGWSYGAGSRVLLLIDDIPALQADAGFPNWNDVPIENISNVEVVKGAASALYGSSAMNGIINIRTAYAKSEPYTKISTFATLYDQPANDSISWWKDEYTRYKYDDEGVLIDSAKYKPSFFNNEDGYNRPAKIGFSLAHRQKFGRTDLVLSAYGLNSQSFRESVYSKYGRINMGVRHRISDRLSIGFNSNFNKGKSRSYFYWKDHELNRLRADTSALSNSDKFRFTIDPFLTYFDKSGNRHKIMTRYFGIDNQNDNGQDNKSGLFYTEYQFQKRWDQYNLDLTTGLVGTWTNVEAPLYNGKYSSSNYAAYLQLDKKFFDKLNLSAGLRYEHNRLKNEDFIIQDTLLIYDAGTAIDDKPVFRLGANYQAHDFTFIRASWGQGYRYPVIAEKFILTNAGGINVIPNPDLEPETGWSAEIGIKQGFKISNFNGYVDLAAFWNEYDDMMEFGLNVNNAFDLFAFQSNNIGNTQIKGIEGSIAGEGNFMGLSTTLIAGYTYIEPKYADLEGSFEDFNDSLNLSTANYNVLKYRSKHSFKFDIESRYKMISVGLAANYNSKIEAIDPILSALVGIGKYRAKNDHGFTNFSARLAFIPNDHITLRLIVDNLFNQEYMVRPGLLEAPRSYTLRFGYTL